MKKTTYFTLIASVLGTLAVSTSSRAIGAIKMDMAEFKKLYSRPTEIPYPPENPYSKAKAELGRQLFFDPRLSGSQVTSCATCHNPSFSWGDGLPKGVGNGHKQLGRRSPTILNLAWCGKIFWDGRAANLEEQALGPIASGGEMNLPFEGESGLLARLSKIKGYKTQFDAAFPGEAEPLTAVNIGKAIATFERSVVSEQAPFDRFIEGDQNAISESAQRGLALFSSKARCYECHSGWNFTDNSFQDIGRPDDDLGRGKLVKMASQQHAFKTPTLRNADERAPYMHDGSEATLEAVVDFYNIGGKAKRESLSASIQPLNLTDDEKKDIVAFLKTLTSKDKEPTYPHLPR